MPELQAMTPPVAHEVAGEAEPAWSATKTLWTAWLMPAATARHATRLPLWRAWCAHLLALLLAALLFEFFVCWDFEWNLDQARSSFMNLLGELINAFAQRPVETTVATVTLFIGIELAFLVLAGAVTAWAARDERLRSSFAHALRQTWLHTAHALPAVLLIGLALVWSEKAQKYWRVTHPFPNYNAPYPTPPAQPTPPPAGTARSSNAWREYRAAYRRYHKEVDAQYREYNQQWMTTWYRHARTQPWHVRYADLLTLSAMVLVLSWVVWALFRGLGTRADLRIVERPPTCETCGYNLTGTPMDGRCPECGVPAVESIGPQVRAGSPWARRREMGRLRAWRRCCIDPIRRPRRLGRHIPVDPMRAPWKSLLAANLALISLVGIAAAILCPSLAFGWYPITLNPLSAFETAVTVAFFVALFCLFWATTAASLVGLAARVLYKRNLLPAALQITACLSGYLFLASLASLALGVGLVIVNNEHLLDELVPMPFFPGAMWMPGAAIGWFIMLIWTLLVLLVHLVLLLRGTSGARYANH